MKSLIVMLVATLLSIPARADVQKPATNRNSLNYGEYAFNYQCYETAIHWLQPLANQGIVEAEVKLGTMYMNGWGVKQDSAEATKWYSKVREAADHHDPDAQWVLGNMYSSGTGVRHDETEAQTWWNRAVKIWQPLADEGNVEAQYRLANAYERGEGVVKDYAVAMQQYQKAANQGSSDAQYYLAKTYSHGQRPKNEDYATAIKWALKAANQGDWRAQDLVGGMYARGTGAKQDDAEALKWLQTPAEHGDPWAMLSMGSIYEAGLSSSKDPTKAYFWYRLAKKLMTGFKPGWNHEAQAALDGVSKQLTLDKKTEVDRKVEEWLSRKWAQ